MDRAQDWIAAAAIGILTACVASVVDVGVAVVADWKEGYCRRSPWLDRRSCCGSLDGECEQWQAWASSFRGAYATYVAFALVFGAVAGAVTMTTKATLPVAHDLSRKKDSATRGQDTETTTGKVMYLAAGSGILEIKTILSGFVIPHFLDFKVLVVKAVSSVFAVSTGMCLGKEGPFVHISTYVGYLVAMCFPKYRRNPRKLREMLSVAYSAGLSVAFGAPIRGVLFSYEMRARLAKKKGLALGLTSAPRKSALTSRDSSCGEPSSAPSARLPLSASSTPPAQGSWSCSRLTTA